MSRIKNNQTGIALILALFLLVIIATFAAFLTSKTRAALIQANNFKNAAKASYVAKAGLHRALYELKFNPQSGHAACAGVSINAYDAKTEAWYFNYGNNIAVNLINAATASFSGLYSSDPSMTEEVALRQFIRLKIVDSASLININMPDTQGLNALLLNLHAGALSAAQVTTIISSRPLDGYKRLSDIKPYIGESTYALIKPYLTVRSFCDTKLIRAVSGTNRFVSISNNPADGEMRSPINVNTADYEVLRAVFRGLAPAISNSEADELANRIRTHTITDPFTSWDEFDNYITNIQTSVFSNPASDAAIVKRGVNPNRAKDADHTTDLCFASEGYFEIHSLGMVVNPFGTPVATRTYALSTKLYDVLRFSTRDDFIGRPDGITATITDDNGNGAPNILDNNYNNPDDLEIYFGNSLKPGFRNVTWYDSTPIDPNDDLGFRYRTNYMTIPGSLKLGFWDNFDENPAESGLIWLTNWASDPSINHMVDVGLTPYWDATTASSLSLDVNDNELWHHFDDDPMDDIINYNGLSIPSPFSQTEGQDDDFVAFRLGQLYNRWEPLNASMNSYRRWGYNLYLRVFNSEGPRAVATHTGITPGILGSDFPGRNYLDVGYIVWRFDDSRDVNRRCCLLSLSTLGNYYSYEIDFNPYDMDGNGEILNHTQAIRNVSALYPPSAFLPAPPAPQIIDASSERFAFINDPQPPFPNHMLARNYINQLNCIYMTKSNPWNIPWYWEGIERVPAFLNVAQTTPLRDKTFRIISKNDDALLQVAYDGLANYNYITMFNETALLPHQYGSIALYGKASHPAWDDLRIIGSSGEYTTAAFSPGTISPTNSNILWGTVAWTETFESSAPSGPAITMRLLFAEGAPPAEDYAYSTSIAFSQNDGGTGHPILNGTSAIGYPFNYVRLHMTMGVVDICPGYGRAPNIPVLEDITLTYLPETVIYYAQET